MNFKRTFYSWIIFALHFEVRNESFLEWGCNKSKYFTDAPPLPDSHSVRWITLISRAHLSSVKWMLCNSGHISCKPSNPLCWQVLTVLLRNKRKFFTLLCLLYDNEEEENEKPVSQRIFVGNVGVLLTFLILKTQQPGDKRSPLYWRNWPWALTSPCTSLQLLVGALMWSTWQKFNIFRQT